MDEGDICKGRAKSLAGCSGSLSVTGSGWECGTRAPSWLPSQVGVIPAWPGGGGKPGVPTIAAEREAQVAEELLQRFCGVIMAALHETW
jgi:hypothetical protein